MNSAALARRVPASFDLLAGSPLAREPAMLADSKAVSEPQRAADLALPGQETFPPLYGSRRKQKL